MKKLKLITFMLAIAFVLAACGSEGGTAKEENNENAQTEKQNTDSSAFPMTIEPTVAALENEESGQVTYEEVTFDQMPERIVVFDYGFLDTLDALGVKGIVGVAKDSSLPAHLEEYEGDEYSNIGTLKEPLFEDIAELGPDVIFISERQAPFYEELKKITPNVVFVGTQQDDYWNTFLASVDIAAKLFDKEAEAEEHLAKFDTALEEIKTLAGNFETSLVAMYNGGKLSGFGTESRFGYIYELYGFKPATEEIQASDHGSNFGFESILEIDPEVLLVIDRSAATKDNTSNIEDDMENEIVQQTIAYKNNRIVYLDGPLWYLGGGGLQSELAKIDEVLAELK